MTKTENKADAKQPSKKMGLTTAILIALVLGIIFGLSVNLLIEKDILSAAVSLFFKKYIIGSSFEGTVNDTGAFTVVGKMFISSIKMMVVPLVFVSLICGVTGMGDIGKLGRVGTKTLAFYLLTTALAIGLALLIANLLNPGQDVQLNVEGAKFVTKEAPSLAQVIINIIPSNPFNAVAKGSMLQIIFFSLLMGLSIASLGKKVQGIITFFNELNDIIMQMVTLIMLAAPYGIFCLIAKVFASQGIDMIKPLAMYMFAVILTLLVHLTVVYSGALTFVARLSIITFFRKFYSTMLVAFSTASSNATIPITMRSVTEKLGVSRSIASFSIPFGATINMDGTAIMQGVAVIFIAQVYGIDLTMLDFMTVILTATLASIGTAGVPGVGLITLSMVLTQVGLPTEGIALIIGIDRLLDMSRTAVNICGDAIVSIIVAKSEGEFDKECYDNPLAGTGDELALLEELDEHMHESQDIHDKDEKEWKEENAKWDNKTERE